MLGFFWSCDGSKRDLAGKQARSYCLSVIFSENRFRFLGSCSRNHTQNWGSGGAPCPKKEARPTGPGTSYIAAQYSQEMPKNNAKARATAPNRLAFSVGRQGSKELFAEKP
jgi:hypothetical protein